MVSALPRGSDPIRVGIEPASLKAGADRLAAMSRADSPLRDRMIFCVGAQRSGTTWLQRMLAVHPDVVTLPSETQLISVGMTTLARQTHQGAMSSRVTGRTFMEADAFADAARDFCDAVFGRLAESLAPDARFVLERSPNHAEWLGLVSMLYPDARVVHIIRDGRDVARSLVSQHWGPSEIKTAASRWRRAVENAQQAAPAFAVYAEVRYEDLLSDTRRHYTDLLAKLGLTADPDTVDEAIAEAARARNVDVSRPRIAQGKWQSVWSPADLAVFEAEAGPLLYGQLGYPRLPATARPPTSAERARRLGRRALTRARPAGALLAGDDAPDTSTILMRPNPNPVRVCDDFISTLATAQVDRIPDQLSADAVVRVLTRDDVREDRGDAGARLLANVVAAEGSWGRQVRGDVFPGQPTISMAFRHERDGIETDRVLVLRAEGWSITHVDYFRFGDVDGRT
jgi:muconolactone delta-isomerase